MQSFFTNYLSNLQELHNDIRSTLEGLPQKALDWTPGFGINSLNVLVAHLTGAERYWLGDVVARRLDVTEKLSLRFKDGRRRH